MRLDAVETRHLSAASAEMMVSVTGEIRREVLRTDRYGRRYLRFSVAGEGASIRCYWFLGTHSLLDRLRQGSAVVCGVNPAGSAMSRCWWCDRSENSIHPAHNGSSASPVLTDPRWGGDTFR